VQKFTTITARPLEDRADWQNCAASRGAHWLRIGEVISLDGLQRDDDAE
jgi:hypothetical protein